ncbi:hypothetical protein [Billgrantia montanilacus]|uniref:Secreted protein n=1 Tax=Billgrantia montanilacus TaxID=2282305 RepID=A0A368TYT2_9GAMM|nr:hypothetical protein [Halomonas montanilacus]RCV89888.1 hypothetical protein DU505_09060 [Halomonas montanilacus]
MKVRRRLSCVGLVALLALSGCGNDTGPEDTGPADDEVTNEAPEAVATDEVQAEPAEEVPEAEPLEVAIDVTATLRNDRRLMVEGETNLPEMTRLLIVVERELSGVRWQSRTEVQGNRFEAGPFGPGSGLPDGGYTITVNLPESTVQPPTIRERIGDQGEHLAGPLVRRSRHGLGQVASYSRRYLIGNEPRRTTDEVEVLDVE